jgi:hypothetical protein
MEAIFKPDLINLPWATLLTLACGYAGYYVANVGIRDHHKPIDIIFSTLVFGFFSSFAYNILFLIFEWRILWASAATFALALILGALWSRFGRVWLEWSLRNSTVSYSDDLPNAWIALFSRGPKATQLTLKLKDGSWLKCDNLSAFADMPNGPCTLGAKGDVLLYVTHYQPADNDDFIAADETISPGWGVEITYIPADQIVRIDIRRVS